MIYLIGKILTFILISLVAGWLLGSAWYRLQLRRSNDRYVQLRAEFDSANQSQQDLLLSKERGLMQENHRRRELESAVDEAVTARMLAEQRLQSLEESLDRETGSVQELDMELRTLRESHQKTMNRLRELEESGAADPGHSAAVAAALRETATRLEQELSGLRSQNAQLESDLRIARGRTEAAESERLELRMRVESGLLEREDLQRRIRLLEDGGRMRVQAILPPLPASQITAPLAARLQTGQSAAVLLQERPNRVDDLTCIAGIGRKLEKLLNGLGIWQLEQLAALSPEQICWVDEKLSFRGRIHRENWVGQAGTMLATRGAMSAPEST
jgi:predicted flap endonuclease-1-like 5' DNA nuclease